MTVHGKTGSVPLRDEGLLGIRYAREVLFFSFSHEGETVVNGGKRAPVLFFLYGTGAMSSSGKLNTPLSESRYAKGGESGGPLTTTLSLSAAPDDSDDNIGSLVVFNTCGAIWQDSKFIYDRTTACEGDNSSILTINYST